VVVEARRGDAHLAREVAHRDAVDAVRREEPLRRVEDQLARRRRGCASRERTFAVATRRY
jgi:hypothetical protein